MKHNDWFTIRRLTPQVYALAEFSHFEKAISYLVVGSSQAVLFDTGMGYADIWNEIRQITNLPVSVFLTHAHWDHIGGLSEPGAYVYNHPFELDLLKKGFVTSQIEELSASQYFDNPFTPKEYCVAPYEQYQLVDQDQIIIIDEFNIRVIHTPGHTPGSVCYLVEPLNIAFVGDTFYPGPLYAQLPESNVLDYAASLADLKGRLRHDTRIFPGHNEVESSVEMIGKAAALMHQVAQGKAGGPTEVMGDGFSIIYNSSGKRDELLL